jgi:hypothetical protein
MFLGEGTAGPARDGTFFLAQHLDEARAVAILEMRHVEVFELGIKRSSRKPASIGC